jgi:hypothetical protein
VLRNCQCRSGAIYLSWAIYLAFPEYAFIYLLNSIRSHFSEQQTEKEVSLMLYMRHRLVTVVLAALLAGFLAACKKSEPATGSTSKEGVLLKVKWPVGARYVYRMDLDQHSTNKFPQMPQGMKQDVTMAMTYALSVVKEIADGGRDLEIEFLANEMEVKMGAQVVMSFDSKEDSSHDAQNPLVAPYRKMIGSKLHLEVDANGKVEQIIGLQEWTDRMSADAGPAKGMIAQQFNEGYFRQIADFGLGFLNRPVQPGETWPFKMDMPLGPMGKLKVDSKLTFKGWEDREQHKCVVIKSTGSLQGSPSAGAEAGPMGMKMSIKDGKMSATGWFDPELGAQIETVADQALQVKGEMPSPPGGKGPTGFTSEIGQKVSLKLVELGKVKE